MKLTRTLCVLVAAVVLCSAPVFGAEGVSAADRSKILEILPELSAGTITTSPIPGLYQIMLGGQISYISADGRYLIQGDIYDTVDERNLTENHRESCAAGLNRSNRGEQHDCVPP